MERLPKILLSISVILWAVSILFTNLQIGDYGLVFSLNPIFYVSIFIITISFFYCIKKDQDNFTLVLHLIFLALIFLSIPIAIEKTPRFTYNYLSAGNIDYILQNGYSNPAHIAYQSWPGIFYLGTILTYITSISPIELILYVPIILSIISIPLGFLLARSLLKNKKEAWAFLLIGLLIFFGSAIYFVPGVLAGFLATILIYLLIKHELLGKNSYGFMFAFIIICVSMVVSHWLTSMNTLIVLAILILLNFILTRNTTKFFNQISIAIFAFATICVWQIYMTDNYSLSIFISTINGMLNEQTNLQNTYSAVQSMGFSGSAAHSSVVYVHYFAAFILVALAMTGLLQELISDRKISIKNYILALWLLSNTLLILITAYSGEILSRVFSASEIILNMFAAKNINNKFLSILLISALLIFPALSIINAYGDEYNDYVPTNEISGSNFLYERSVEGSNINSLNVRLWVSQYSDNLTWNELDPDYDEWNISYPGINYVLISTTDIQSFEFMYGTVNTDELASISNYSNYNKIYENKNNNGYIIYEG
jgi:hypothetical protein